MLSVRNLTKVYKLGKGKNAKQVVALNNVSIDFPDKGLVFLLGKSGSGKSTLLNSIGGLDTFDEGEIIIKGKSSKSFKQSDFDSYRNTFIGFIFQEYNILDEFSVGKNLALALELQGKKADKEAVENLLAQVDLEGYYKRKPNQLSGGQKQRVAIARALIKDPEIIMADEPTGALDSNTGRQVMDTLKKLSKTKLVIIVSHDREFAHLYGDRVIELKDGQIINDDTKKEVEAEKSESGVSFIDNKIVHIKKGQKVTKQDVEKIVKLISENSAQTDTLISFDSKTNDEVKRTAFITDEGNREVFVDTKPEDVKQAQHDPKDFKLIRSRLKLKDSFKMGASSLKHKPVRLIFTIILACIAFTMFGVVDTLASFNRATAVRESLNHLKVNTVAITRNYRSGWDNGVDSFNEKALEKLQNKFSGYQFEPVIYAGGSYYIPDYGLSTETGSSTSIYQTRASGIMKIDQSTLNEYNLQLLPGGKLPTSEDEICISNHIAQTYIKYATSVDDESDLLGRQFYVSGNNGNDSVSKTIVGIIKDDTDLSRYDSLSDKQSGGNIDDYMKQVEITTVLTYGLVNMAYVNSSTFEKLKENYTPTSVYLSFSQTKDSGGWGLNYGGLTSIEKADISKITHIKPGVDIENLKRNQIIIGGNINTNLSLTADDIDDGAYVYIRDFDYEHPTKYEVVGITTSYKSIVNTEYFISISGYDYAITRLGGNKDRELLNYIEDNVKDKHSLEVQFAASPILDNFGSIISTLTQVLGWVGLLLAVFSGLMLMNFIATSISYKKREIGILRAIGARGKDVFAIFFSESFIICLINFALSMIATIVCCVIINNVLYTQLGFAVTLLSFGIRQFALLLGVSFLVAFVSSFFPVNKTARKNPIDSINNR